MQNANPLPNVAGLCKGFLLSCKAGACFTCKAQPWEQGSLFSRWNAKRVQLMGIRKGQTVWQRLPEEVPGCSGWSRAGNAEPDSQVHVCKAGTHRNTPHRTAVSFPLLDVLKSEGCLPLKDALTQRRMSVCVEGLSCALTQPAPVTPWDRGITTTCALVSAPKRVFSACRGQSQRDGVAQLPHFPRLIFSLPIRTIPKAI